MFICGPEHQHGFGCGVGLIILSVKGLQGRRYASPRGQFPIDDAFSKCERLIGRGHGNQNANRCVRAFYR